MEPSHLLPASVRRILLPSQRRHLSRPTRRVDRRLFHRYPRERGGHARIGLRTSRLHGAVRDHAAYVGRGRLSATPVASVHEGDPAALRSDGGFRFRRAAGKSRVRSSARNLGKRKRYQRPAPHNSRQRCRVGVPMEREARRCRCRGMGPHGAHLLSHRFFFGKSDRHGGLSRRVRGEHRRRNRRNPQHRPRGHFGDLRRRCGNSHRQVLVRHHRPHPYGRMHDSPRRRQGSRRDLSHDEPSSPDAAVSVRRHDPAPPSGVRSNVRRTMSSPAGGRLENSRRTNGIGSI
mmetsp:Transcript_19228/g.43790  ORF Transcript_19228/g.43790 Transcript_19228/m.43790 type:complete len:289 (+) Transcript_19228:1027-1893(+)